MPIPGTTPVTAMIAPTSELDSYPTHKASWGLGGFQGVATLADRDAIVTERREANMWVYVLETDTVYILQSDKVTWTEKPYGPTQRYRTMYIDAAAMSATLVSSVPNATTWTDELGTVPKTVDSYLLAASGSVDWKMALPEEWDLQTLKVKYYFGYASGSAGSSPHVTFGIKACYARHNDSLSLASWGTEVTTSSSVTPDTSKLFQVTSDTITPGGAGSITAGSLLLFRITRVSGSYSGDIKLFGVAIQWREQFADIAAW